MSRLEDWWAFPYDEKQRRVGGRSAAEGLRHRSRVADDVTGRDMVQRLIVEEEGEE